MKQKTILITLFALLSTSLDMYGQNDQYSTGLFFSSHEEILDKRTSLCLTPDRSFVFNKSFSIEFDAKFRKGDGYYGLICRLIGDKSTNIDLISNLGSEKANFWLVVKDVIPLSYKLAEIPKGAFNSWIKIRMDIDMQNSKISVSFNGNKKEKTVKGISGLHDFEITFGACKNLKFLNADVSPMTIKDIVILNHNNKIFREWKLSKHSINEVYDEVATAKATVSNGRWLADKHIKWEKLKSLKVSHLIGIAKDEQEGVIYLIGQKYLLSYSVPTDKIDTIYYANGCPYNNYYNYFIFNSSSQQIWSYDFASSLINKFDFKNRSWEQSNFSYKEPDYAHHNKVISPVNGNLITFGGYGHYKYKSQFNIYDLSTNNWRQIDASNGIPPRYLSASGLDGNGHWLIFGGYGSKSGRQEVSPEFYYDLYSVDLKNYHVKKLCTYEVPAVPFVPCEGLVKKPNSNFFYTLFYNPDNFTSSLRLARFSTNDSKYTLYPDSIPYNFSDKESWCTFFLHEKSSTILAATAHKSDVEIYSLAYPPLLKSEVIQPAVSGRRWIVGLMVLVIFTGIICFLLIIFNRKKIQKKLHSLDIPFVASEGDKNMASFEIPKRKSKSSIYFLGGFQVFDREGNDITASFTPTLKQLFAIILLNTVKNGRGIYTNKLDEILWFDKSDNSARNNRNVSISKLRGLLEKVGNMVDIDQESSYWRVKMDGIYSDYMELTSMSEKFKHSDSGLTEAEILRFVQVAYQGELLPDFKIDWLDEFKADFSNLVLDTLSEFTTQPDVKKNHYLLNHIAECILKFDTTNEEAIVLKCTTLYKLGKKGLAKTAYDSFVREYYILLGTNYPVSFKDIIKQAN
ncbi:MAG: hypothetical protein Q8904_09565 [Bacteroidota bacterium]|nr:hypothetical protein [Bacteroidota bacterium]